VCVWSRVWREGSANTHIYIWYIWMYDMNICVNTTRYVLFDHVSCWTACQSGIPKRFLGTNKTHQKFRKCTYAYCSLVRTYTLIRRMSHEIYPHSNHSIPMYYLDLFGYIIDIIPLMVYNKNANKPGSRTPVITNQ
jgi:hypothetical protein